MTKKVLKEYPSFKSEWLSLANDENGKSPYHPTFTTLVRKFADLENFRTSYTQKEFSQGFASDYARTSFLEDVAELGEMVETGSPHHRFIEAEPNLREDSPLIKKLQLLQKAEMIPKEFMEHLHLQRKYIQCVHPGLPGLANNTNNPYSDFITSTQNFLNKYPSSRYSPYLKEKLSKRKII